MDSSNFKKFIKYNYYIFMSNNNYNFVTIYDPSCNNPPTYRTSGRTVLRPWARTQGQLCYNNCTQDNSANCISVNDLNMRRKAEVLKHNNNTVNSSFTKKQKYSMIARGKHPGKKQYSSQTISVTNLNTDPNFQKVGNSLVSLKPCIIKNTGLASQSDVPGNKNFVIENDNNIPLTNYKVQRTFKGAQESWPQTRWDTTKEGFAVGKSGSAHPYIYSNYKIGNFFEGEYWTNETQFTVPFRFSSILARHNCVLEGVNMSLENITEPINIGVNLRTKEIDGQAQINLVDSKTTIEGRTVNPGNHTFSFNATPDRKYNNIGIQLKQSRNEERSNILYLNPFIISTNQPEHNFLSDSAGVLINGLGSFIENEYWANKDDLINIVVDVSGVISYVSDFNISGSLNTSYPETNNEIKFTNLNKGFYTNVNVYFQDYAEIYRLIMVL